MGDKFFPCQGFGDLILLTTSHRVNKLNNLLDNVLIFDLKLFGGTGSDFAIDIKEKKLMDFFLVHRVFHKIIETRTIFDNFL